MKRSVLAMLFVILIIMACNNKSGTTVSSEKKDTAVLVDEEKDRKRTTIILAVDDIVDAFNDQHFIATFKDYSPDVVDYGDGSGAPIKGIDSVRSLSLSFFNSFSNFKSEDVHIVADGDQVILWAKWSATWSKDFAGQKATGKTFHVVDADLFKFDDNGKIIEHHSVQSFKNILSQIGMK